MRFLRLFAITAFLYFLNSNILFALNLPFNSKTISPLDLIFPVACNLEENCWLVNYPDINTGEELSDYKNGEITYEGNKGTDIAISTIQDLKKGVPVLAAQNGIVIFVRDGIADNLQLKSKDAQKDIPFCGNSVVIEHNNGWSTIYCHLKKDSINVKVGDFAKEGGKIAEIGLSGKTNFPHLYFSVLHNKNYFDPFSGLELTDNSIKEKYEPLWSPTTLENLEYQKIIVSNIGVSDKKLSMEQVKNGNYEKTEILNNIQSIYLHVYGFHFNKGDFIKISLTDPDQKKILTDSIKVTSDEMENLFNFEKKREGAAWKPGIYNAKISVISPALSLVYEYNFNFEIKEPKKPVDEEALRKKKLHKKLMLKKKEVMILKKLYDENRLPKQFKNRKKLIDRLKK